MIDWLITSLVPLTLLLSLLLAAHPYILKNIGPHYSYKLWGLVPLTLIIPLLNIPSQWVESAGVMAVQRYITLPTNSVEAFSSTYALSVIWLVFTLGLLSYWLVTHVWWINKLQLSVVEHKQLPIQLPKGLHVYYSANSYGPMLIGLITPKLIIPEHFFTLYTKEQQVLILEHEVCHFNRSDIHWNLMAMCTVALFWFHPLSWLAFMRFRRDQELSCDHLVLARKHKLCRINYSKALLVAADQTPPFAFAQLSFKKNGAKHIMFERIHQIKTNTKASKLALSVITAVSVTLLSGFSVAGNKGHNAAPTMEKADQIYPVMRVEPKYPIQAARDNIEGSVVLKFDVLANGQVDNVSVIRAVPEAVFDKAAKTALRQWTYNQSATGSKNQLVQLDFAMDERADKPFENLIEQVVVTQDTH